VNWESAEVAIENALLGNPRAIWGGEVITNFPVSGSRAEMLFSKREGLPGSSKWMLDVIVAPDFDREAIQILGKRRERKLFKNGALTRPYLNKEGEAYRMVRGGFLRQPLPDYILDLDACTPDFPRPASEYLDSLIIAWVTAWFSNHGGNEVAIAKERKLLGVGGGPATIDSCYMAIMRAKQCGHDLKDSGFAADAFFPFTDGPEELVKAGCIYGIVPEGGKNVALVKGCFKKNKVRVFYLPAQFRGFCRH
jgi:phosphoribosylaminoimidazolecarboxamide formyltransferase/IMP cyclohydrolase